MTLKINNQQRERVMSAGDSLYANDVTVASWHFAHVSLNCLENNNMSTRTLRAHTVGAQRGAGCAASVR